MKRGLHRRMVLCGVSGVFAAMMSTSAVSSQVAAAPSSGSGIWAGIPMDASISPWFIAIDSKGDLFATDASSKIAERPTGSTTWKDITNVVIFHQPRGIAVDKNGDLFVANGGNDTIEERPSGSSAWTDITDGGSFAALWGIAADSRGDVFVADSGNNAIKELPCGSTTWKDITNDGSLHRPTSIAVDQNGDVFVADNRSIQELPSGGSVWIKLSNSGSGGIAVDSRGDVFDVDLADKTIEELSSGSKTWESIASDASIKDPGDIAVDSDGDVFVTDLYVVGQQPIIYEFLPRPAIKSIQVAPGTMVGTTKLTATANTKSDRLEYVLRPTWYQTLGIGGTGPADASPLTSGMTKDNIPTSTWVGQYLDVYELNSSSDKVVAFAELRLTNTVIKQNPDQKVDPKKWDGQWYRLDSPAYLTLYNATSQAVGIKFYKYSVGTAYINGNTAVYTKGQMKVTIVMTGTDQIHVLAQNPNASWIDFNGTDVPQVNVNGTYVKKNPLPRITLSVVKPDKVKVAGSTLFAPGTWLTIEVSNGQRMPIYWETTVDKGGVIDSEEDMSWLPSGAQNLVANVSVMSRTASPGYWNMGALLQVTSNPVHMTIQHKNIGQDVRAYYKPGTPVYTVADFVYRDGSDSKGMESDTLPGHGVTNLASGGGDWIQLKGVDIYGLHYVSKMSAVADTTLLIGQYYTDQSLDYKPVGGPALYFDYDFKLTRYQGKWLIDGTDFDNALSRLYDVSGLPM